MKTFLYQINVTRDCNLRCTHCYIHSDVKANSKTMQDHQIEQIAYGIVEHMKAIKYQRAEIHFIGGEPSMLGLEFYQRNLPIFRKIVQENGFITEIMMITNLLHKDILEMGKMFDRVSTSYEPETRFVSWTGKQKPKLKEQWIKNVHLMKANNVNLNVTTAMTKQVLAYGAKKILDEYYEMGIKQVHFGFFIPEGDGLVNIDSVFPPFVETSNFLIETAAWNIEKSKTDPDCYVNPFQSMLSAIHADEPFDDIVCPIISGSMDIHWDGHASPCIEEGGSLHPDWAGNVFNDGVLKTYESTKYQKKIFAAKKPNKYCMDCDEYNVCKSGCGVLFKFWKPEEHDDCPGFKKFIKHVRKLHQEGLRPKSVTEGSMRNC